MQPISPQCEHCQTQLAPNDPVCPQCGRIHTAPSTGPTIRMTGRTQFVAPQPASSPSYQYEPLKPGQVLKQGAYTIEQALSEGAMGAIYLAIDHHMFKRNVVIKEMKAYCDINKHDEVQEARQRFEREAVSLTRLSHPAIPRIFDYFSEGNQHYIVMEYIEGHDLDTQLSQHNERGRCIRKGKPYNREDIIRWGIELCKVLEYLANQKPDPVVHHDIKPANILLDQNGTIRLVDFGTAKERRVAPGRVGIGKSSVFGTAGYAPPEQYNGQSEPCSDVYALAATLYHLATDDDPGHDPFKFPKLGTLSDLGSVLKPALTTDVKHRVTAQALRQELEGLVTRSLRVNPIEAPTGEMIVSEEQLAQWCEAHWEAAATWLYGELPGQIERFWAKNKLAADLRAIVAQHRSNRNAGVDALLRRLDPHFPPPQISFAPSRVDFGSLSFEQRGEQTITLSNTGRGLASVKIVGEAWVTPNSWSGSGEEQVELLPGQSTEIRIFTNPAQTQLGGRLRANLQLKLNHGTTYSLTAMVHISRLRTIGVKYVLPYCNVEDRRFSIVAVLLSFLVIIFAFPAGELHWIGSILISLSGLLSLSWSGKIESLRAGLINFTLFSSLLTGFITFGCFGWLIAQGKIDVVWTVYFWLSVEFSWLVFCSILSISGFKNESHIGSIIGCAFCIGPIFLSQSQSGIYLAIFPITLAAFVIPMSLYIFLQSTFQKPKFLIFSLLTTSLLLLSLQGAHNYGIIPQLTVAAVPTEVPSRTSQSLSVTPGQDIPTVVTLQQRARVVGVAPLPLRVRAAPSTGTPIIARLTEGTEVVILDDTEGWYHIRTDTTEGWVSADYLEFIGS